MTIEPVTYNLTIYQGASFSQNMIWQDQEQQPIDLTGYTARMMARTSVNAAEPFLTLTTENGGITLGDDEGTIVLTLTATQTAALTETLGLYDLELIVPGGGVVRLLQGNLTVSKEVTR